MALSRDDVAALYIAMFQRAPSKSELDTWYQDAINNNRDLGSMAETMLQAATLAVNGFGLADLYPQYANIDPHNPQAVRNIIESVYQTLFNKDYTQDPEGIDGWVDQVVSGKQSFGQAIASIVKIGEGIATNPDTYKPFFDTDIDFQNAYKAAKAFEAKLDASQEVANIINNVKVDKLALQKMQDLLHNIDGPEDLQIVRVEAENIKNEVEDPNDMTQDMNDNQNRSSDYTYSGDDTEDDIMDDVNMILSLDPAARAELINLAKTENAQMQNLYNSYSSYNMQMLQQMAQIEQDFENKIAQFWHNQGIPYKAEVVTPSDYFLQQDPALLQQHYNLAKQYHNAMAQYFNQVNPYDTNSVKQLIMEDDKYWNQIDDLESNSLNSSPVNYDDPDDTANQNNTTNTYSGDYYVNGIDYTSYDVHNLATQYNLDEQQVQNYLDTVDDLLSDGYLIDGNCANTLINKIQSLSPQQLQSLAQEIVQYANTSPYLADGQITLNEYAGFEQDISNIYSHYGIDIHQLMSDCGYY